MQCKVSDQQIKPFMLFGKMPITNDFLDKKNFKRIVAISHTSLENEWSIYYENFLKVK